MAGEILLLNLRCDYEGSYKGKRNSVLCERNNRSQGREKINKGKDGIRMFVRHKLDEEKYYH